SLQINLKISLIKAAKSLAEVTIAERRQLVKVAVDKITYDVKNDPDKAHATTLEMLEKVPLISLGPNDAISVDGKKTYVILIDGKPSNILTADPSTALRNLAANKVDQVEILTTPPSR